MFDLFRSRQKAVRYVLIGLLSLVALSMVMYLIPGFGMPTVSSSAMGDGTLAEVGGSKITAQDVINIMGPLVQRGQLPPEYVDIYVPQAVDEMVQERAIAYEFGKMGLTVSDDEVLDSLQQKNPQFFKDGALISKEEFAQRVAQQGMTLQDLVDETRRQLMLSKVRAIVEASVVVPEQEVEAEYRRQKERATIEYIAFPPAKFQGDVKPTDQELHAMFEAHHNEYFTPEKRSFQVLIVDQAKIEQTLTVSDADAKALYNSSIDNFRVPERVHARHILVKTEGMNDAQKKQALAKAQDLLKQLKAGADFATLAQKNSDDSSNAPKGGDLGWFGRGQMVPEFDNAVFALKPGELSGIVTTQFGYHIVKVDEKENARVKPFEEVKAQIEDEIKKQRVTEKVQQTADQVHDALAKAPGSAAEIAKKFGVDIVSVTDATAGTPVPTLGAVPEIDGVLGQMKPNDVTQVIQLPANRLVVAVLTNKTPARPATFDEVEGKVRDRYVSEKTIAVAKQKAEEAAAKIKAGEDMEKVAKEYKLEVAKPAEFGRADSVEGLGQATYVLKAFTSPVGTVLGPIDITGRDVIYKVTAKNEADMAAFQAEKEGIRNTLRGQRANERWSLFMDSVTAKLEADGKLKVNHDLIQKLAADMKRS